MKYAACSCTLPYLNPGACQNCSVWKQNQIEDSFIPYTPYSPPYQPDTLPWVTPTTSPINWPQYPTKTVKRITRTIEKYDEMGNYKGKEVITEDHEDVQVPDYSKPAQMSGGTTIFTGSSGSSVTINNPSTEIYNGSVSSGSITYKKDNPATYTTNGGDSVDPVLNNMGMVSGQVVSNLANSACYVNTTNLYN